MAAKTDSQPSDIDIHDAAALMGGDPASPEASQDGESGEGQPSEAEGDPASPEASPDDEIEEGQPSEADGEGGDAPEFWSAEDKAAWKGVPTELRPVLKKYERQRLAFVNEKAREAAALRTQASEEVHRAHRLSDQAAAWWQQNGPAFHKAFADKWSAVDWKGLAEKDPPEVARLIQQRQEEETLLAEANRRGQEDMTAAQARAEQAHQQVRRDEHAKLAAKLPDYFGTPETAAKTYAELARFLLAKGIAADRVATIHEAPIIELALNAMRFELARKKASAVGKTANTSAQRTPTRVAPGPAIAGNRTADAARQVGRRFRESGGASIADAAELIRLSGL